MNRTVGIIDLGSNSVRLTVVELALNGGYRVIAEAKTVVRLAGSIDAQGAITQAGLDRTLATLSDFLRIGRSHGVSAYKAVATAAVRQASNGVEFIKTIAEATGINIRTISEQEEAELSYCGALNTLAEAHGLLIDIGGASTELVAFSNREITAACSIPYGAVNLTNRFLPGGFGSPEACGDMGVFIGEVLSAIPWLQEVRRPVMVGVGGSVRTLCRIDRKARQYPFDMNHNYRLTPGAVAEIYGTLCRTAVADRAQIAGLSDERADIIAGGAAMLYQVLRRTDARELVVSGAGLREGLLHKLLMPGSDLPLVPDVLGHSIHNMLHCYGLDQLRSRETVRLAQRLYDQLWQIHRMNASARRCLTAAAALTEIGQTVNIYGENNHTFYLITRGRLYGLTHREALIAGAAAAFEGQGKAAAMIAPYRALLDHDDEEVVRGLGVIIAMARELTFYEPGCVQDVEVTLAESQVRLRLHAAAPPTSELKRLRAWSGDFRKAFDIALVVEQ